MFQGQNPENKIMEKENIMVQPVIKNVQNKLVRSTSLIYALSVLNIISSKLNAKNLKDKQLLVLNEGTRDPNLEHIGKKVYFPLYVHQDKNTDSTRTILFLDSGSDINLVQEHYLKRLLSPRLIDRLKQPSNIENLVSFSNNVINVLYRIELECSVTATGATARYCFQVIKRIENVPVFLAGSEFMRSSLLTQGFRGDESNPYPEIKIYRPQKAIIKALYQTEQDIFKCNTYVDLQPGQAKTLLFHLNPASPCLPRDKIIISGHIDDINIHITPSQTPIIFDDQTQTYTAFALVINLSNKQVTSEIQADYEISENVRTIPINNANINKLTSYTLISEVHVTNNDIRAPDIVMTSSLPFCTDNITSVPTNIYQIKGIEKIKNKHNKNTRFNHGKVPGDPPHVGQGHVGDPLQVDQGVRELVQGDSAEVEHGPEGHVDEQGSGRIRTCCRSPVETPLSELKDAKLEDYFNPDKSIIIGPDYKENFEITDEMLNPSGLEIPPDILKSAEEIVVLDKYQEPIRGYVEDIFLKSYPQILAKGSLDIGNLSRTLGTYSLALKPNESLPHHQRVYFLNSEMAQHLRDILDFYLKNGVIVKADINDSGAHLFGSPSYLVPRARPGVAARLIIDYSKLNSILQRDPAILPDVSLLLHNLRDYAVYSSTDLANAYLSMDISKESRYLTRFCTQFGSFECTKLSTGLATCPEVFNRAAHKIIHMEVVRDAQGRPIYEKDNVVKMIESPLEGVWVYFDDVFVATKPLATYALTMEAHAKLLKQVMGRIAFHSAKIHYEKSSLFKTKINFLGWVISHNFLRCDPRRVEKMRNAAFPENIKGIRSFLGLIRSLQLCLDFKHLQEVRVLTPLTSSRTPYAPTDEHRRAFEILKEKITSAPIYSRILCPHSEKVLFTDASGARDGYYSATLAQIVPYPPGHQFLPDHIDLEDECHKLIFDHKIDCKPTPIITNPDEFKAFLNDAATLSPPTDEYLNDPYLGYNIDTVDNSLFLSAITLDYISKCKPHTIQDLREKVVQHIKKSILHLQIKDFAFNNNYLDYKNFIEQLKTVGAPDKELYTVQALAVILTRPVMIISSLPVHKDKPILKYNYHLQKPPYIFGLYEKSEKYIYKPFYMDRENIYDLRQLRSRFEIIAYHCRALPARKSVNTAAIIDSEFFAILTSLSALSKYIGNSTTYLLCDSKSLYLLYHQAVHESSTRLHRWSIKLRVDHSHVKLQFIPTHVNLADFLSRRFNCKVMDLPKLGLDKYLVDDDFYKLIPTDRTFSLQEWATFVQQNPQYLHVVSPQQSKSLVASLARITKNLESHISPLSALQDRMSHDNIIKLQREERPLLYSQCIAAPNFQFETTIDGEPGQKFKLQNNLILVEHPEGAQILLPTKLIGVFLAYFHLAGGHAGLKKLLAMMEPYTFTNKRKLITEFLSRCFNCQLQNRPTQSHLIGVTPIFSYAFQCLHLDLAENIGLSGKFENVLIAVCPLTGFTICFPLRTKSASEISYIILYCILPYFSVQYIHSDNAPCFSQKSFIAFLASVNVKKLFLAALWAPGKGLVEATVKSFKQILRKLLVSMPDYNWEGLCYIISKYINHTVCNKTGFTPAQMLFGLDSQNSQLPFNTEIPKLHPLVTNLRTTIEQMNQQVNSMVTTAREIIHENKIKLTEKINTTRVDKQFKVNDIVFCLDRAYQIGNTRPLRTKYSSSPYVVVQVLPTTVIIQRLADGYTQLYSKNDVKVYKPMDPRYSDLPPQVVDIIKG